MPNGPIPFRPRQRRTPPPPPPGAGPWWLQLARDDRGRIISDLANACVGLRPELRGLTHFDEMLQHSIAAREWPHKPEADMPRPYPHEVDDDDITRLTEWLQSMGLRRIGRETVGQAVEMIAREHSFHPVRDYLNALEWDGKERIDRWLFRYFGAEAEDDNAIEYVAAIGKMFLISMVARVMRPGCQCDYMLVLEGDQGSLKSSACRALAGQWFSDSMPENVASKDARQHLRGKWLVEVSELAAFQRTEMEALKAFITRREERYRPPFGRHDVMEPRQCVLVGTTNQEVYIKDATGGRRFWPIRCTAIDKDGIAETRDQLFAEAVAAYQSGVRWWPTHDDEQKFFKPQQERRQEDDPWGPPLHAWTESQILDRVTVSQIARECLGFDGNSRIGTADARRIASILKDLGWTQERTKLGRFYHRPRQNDDG